jgi:hypothetical protein
MSAHALVTRAKVEAKVWATTAAAFVVSVVVSLLNQAEADHSLLGPLPSALQTVILIVAPTAVTFISGWTAKHTPRTPEGP